MRLANYGLRAVAYLAYAVSLKAWLRTILFNSVRLNRTELERFRTQEEYKFLAYVFLYRNRSNSQILQDLWVCYELGERRDGFFVEFGATNGVVNSNTWLLEKHYNWTGILAEPNPVWHEKLSQSRGVAIDHRCVARSTGEVVAFLTTDASDPELSAIAEFASGDHFKDVRAQGVEIKVETVSLNDLLRNYHAPFHIDYISIDTEGSEYDILSQFDFSLHSIDLFSIELNPQTGDKLEALLAGQGYVRVFREFSQWDGWFVKSDLLQVEADRVSVRGPRNGPRFGAGAVAALKFVWSVCSKNGPHSIGRQVRPFAGRRKNERAIEQMLTGLNHPTPSIS